MHPSETSSSSSNSNQNTCSFNLNSKGVDIGHLNVQRLWEDKMSKYSEISAILTAPENNKLHICGMSETKLKKTVYLKLIGFNYHLKKIIMIMAVEESLYMYGKVSLQSAEKI